MMSEKSRLLGKYRFLISERGDNAFRCHIQQFQFRFAELQRAILRHGRCNSILRNWRRHFVHRQNRTATIKGTAPNSDAVPYLKHPLAKQSNGNWESTIPALLHTETPQTAQPCKAAAHAKFMRYGTKKPIRSFTSRTVAFAITAARSAPSFSTRCSSPDERISLYLR